MVLLKTNMDILKYPWKISYQSKLFFAGSCFADEIGRRFVEHKFKCLVNPLGIHFNPVSLHQSLQYVTGERVLMKDQLACQDGRWHHFGFHGVFSGATQEKTLSDIEAQLALSRNFLAKADFAFITLGTAQVHIYKPTTEVVGNNHKFPSEHFESKLLSQQDIVDSLTGVINCIKKLNPAIKIVFTISPVRYLREGMHGNQLSKALLLLAVESVLDRQEVFYFPSYEIFMDDLRDYRFYAEDLVHPSKTGVDYVWEVLTSSTMSEQTQALLSQVKKLLLSFRHRPIYPDSKEYHAFLQKLLTEMKTFTDEHQAIDFSGEIGDLEGKIS